MTRYVLIGEGMLELSAATGGGWSLGYGGDALNTAIHLARMGNDAAFASAIGTDPFSADLRTSWDKEGLDTSLLLTDPARASGLYGITTDGQGERTFTYWRGESAARGMFDLPDASRIFAAADTIDLLYFTLISVAVLPPAGRTALYRLCDAVRARGGRVAFDGNYRPRLCGNTDEAVRETERAVAAADLAFPTLEDAAALTGERDGHALLDRWHALGAAEVVVKLGGDGCLIDDGSLVPPGERLNPVDTSGAGDAFNAGYLHARLAGADPATAARSGHRLAGWVVMRRGAVPAIDSDAPYSAIVAG